MNFGEIFVDGLKYPSKDYLKLIILGILSFIPSMPIIAAGVGTDNFNPDTFPIIPVLISFVLFVVFYLFIFGYLISITKNTVHNNENFPDFKFLDNFVDGIKIIIIHVIYSIIPSILLFIIWVAILGLNQDMISLLNSPEHLLNNVGLIYQILVFFVLSVILYGIFSLLSVMGTMIFAKTGNFCNAFKFKELFNRISSIGILRYIVLIIVLDIILVLISFIGGFINLIPFIGILIFMILLFPYMLICYYRVIGLIYNESETESL